MSVPLHLPASNAPNKSPKRLCAKAPGLFAVIPADLSLSVSSLPFSRPAAPAQLVYLWSRLNPLVRLSLFGIITITAPYLPYALCLFSWALSSGERFGGGGGGGGGGGISGWGLGVVVSDLLGIATGHWWCVLSPHFFGRSLLDPSFNWCRCTGHRRKRTRKTMLQLQHHIDF